MRFQPPPGCCSSPHGLKTLSGSGCSARDRSHLPVQNRIGCGRVRSEQGQHFHVLIRNLLIISGAGRFRPIISFGGGRSSTVALWAKWIADACESALAGGKRTWNRGWIRRAFGNHPAYHSGSWTARSQTAHLTSAMPWRCRWSAASMTRIGCSIRGKKLTRIIPAPLLLVLALLLRALPPRNGSAGDPAHDFAFQLSHGTSASAPAKGTRATGQLKRTRSGTTLAPTRSSSRCSTRWICKSDSIYSASRSRIQPKAATLAASPWEVNQSTSRAR